jgi:hypothetical protein
VSVEALFVGTMDILKEEGFKEFSLGEVPFVSDSFVSATALNSGQHVKEKVLFCTGHLLKYAYNYDNLFRFKNKFRPVWRPVYVCAPKMPWSALADMFVESEFHALSGSALISSERAAHTTSVFILVSPTLYQIPEFKTESKYTAAMNDGLAYEVSVVDTIKEVISYEKIGLV